MMQGGMVETAVTERHKAVDGVPGNHGPAILSKQQNQAAVKYIARQALGNIRHSSGVDKGL